jgi:hypothetical protein
MPKLTNELIASIVAEGIERTVFDSCAYRKSNPGILMVQSAQNWATENESGCLGGA